MRHIRAACIHFTVLLSMLVPCMSAQVVEVLLQGRFEGEINEQTGLATLPVLFSWPASTVYASFVGNAINATLIALPPTSVQDASARFAFRVDLLQTTVESVSATDNTIHWSADGFGPGKQVLMLHIHMKIAFGASIPSLRDRANCVMHPGQHNLTITKLSESSYGVISLDALTVAPGGRCV